MNLSRRIRRRLKLNIQAVATTNNVTILITDTALSGEKLERKRNRSTPKWSAASKAFWLAQMAPHSMEWNNQHQLIKTSKNASQMKMKIFNKVCTLQSPLFFLLVPRRNTKLYIPKIRIQIPTYPDGVYWTRKKCLRRFFSLSCRSFCSFDVNEVIFLSLTLGIFLATKHESVISVATCFNVVVSFVLFGILCFGEQAHAWTDLYWHLVCLIGREREQKKVAVFCCLWWWTTASASAWNEEHRNSGNGALNTLVLLLFWRM